MALAASLLPGFQYRVTDGQHAGEIVTIVSNELVGRKITVEMNGEVGTMLPRQIDETVIGMVQRTTGETIAATPAPEAGIDPGLQELVELSRSHLVQPITDPMDKRLDKFRPRADVVDRYVKRTMSNGMTDVEFLLTYTSDAYRGESDVPGQRRLEG